MAQLPSFTAKEPKTDWLLRQEAFQAKLFGTGRDDEIVLSNGLVSRTFRLKPNAATVALRNLMTGEEMLRAVKPEAVLETDAGRVEVGGLKGQPDLAYLTPEWLDRMTANPGALAYEGFSVGKIQARLDWKRTRSHPGSLRSPTLSEREGGSRVNETGVPWPPKGVHLTLRFQGPSLQVLAHYELYDGIPLFSKRIEVLNRSATPIRIKGFTSEILGLVEPESVVDDNPNWQNPNVSALSDYSFGGMSTNNSNRTAHWVPDKNYTTQVNYSLNTPCDLEMRPPFGPDIELGPGDKFESFRSFILVHDSTERERRSLAVRRMYRILAPWTSENPIMLHLTSTDPKVVYPAIDQAAECGFEMIVISFWSGLDMEDLSETNIAKFREFREYANQKGVELGGYSLLASRSIDKENDIVNPKPIFGASPCLGSKWGIAYFEKLKTFIEKTGFNLLEHDGNYPGDTCASTVHPGHQGFEDSQWRQYQQIAEFYRWCRARGVYLNVPDNYFLAGSNKTGMGYRESNWSLPREQQHIHARQNLYDGTWDKTPSMGWMMVPLVEYQGGGPAATIEPLREHLPDYEMHLANNFGYGAQACYRGPRLYDSPETKAAVVKWVQWFKKYREVLESDVVHVRRADGKNLDCIVHVNPDAGGKSIRAFAMVWNPTDATLAQDLTIPLYYAGLSGSCQVSERDGKSKSVRLDEQGRMRLKVTVPARSCTWFAIR